MSDHEAENESGQPEPVSRDEFQQLLEGLEDLRTGYAELREASNGREREQAEDDVADARADLSETAKKLGISPQALRKAADAAKHNEDKERLRPILRELLDELLPGKSDEPPAADDPPKDHPKQDPPAEDDPPRLGHWSERVLNLW